MRHPGGRRSRPHFTRVAGLGARHGDCIYAESEDYQAGPSAFGWVRTAGHSGVRPGFRVFPDLYREMPCTLVLRRGGFSPRRSGTISFPFHLQASPCYAIVSPKEGRRRRPQIAMAQKRAANPHKRKLRNISLVIFAYVVSALFFYDLRHGNLPGLADMFIEFYTFPLRYMFRPLYPVLKPFDLVVSDGAELPKAYGIVVGSLIYIAVIMILSYLFTPPKEKRREHQEYWDV